MQIVGRLRECANLVDGGGDRLLDVGCGYDWLASLVLSKGFRGYVGIDEHLRVGPQASTGEKTFVEASIFKLPFPNESFDAVSLFDVIEHIPKGSEELALREIRRVIKNDGRLYFSTPHASPLHTMLDPTWWFLGHRHYRRRTFRQLLTLLSF